MSSPSHGSPDGTGLPGVVTGPGVDGIAERPPLSDVGDYVAVEKLGKGSYGEVWLGWHKSDQNLRVAIKFLTARDAAADAVLDEVRALLRLDGDHHIVRVVNFSEPEALPPYFVMEYMAGGTLADLIGGLQERPSAEQVDDLVRELVRALIFVHNHAIVHCDLKPSNVLMDISGRPKLADFGQARYAEDGETAYGTFFYMAPEQAAGEAVSASWDVYALGAILFEFLTGRPPHRDHPDADSLFEIKGIRERLRRYAALIRKAEVPRDHDKLVDKPLARIIRRCLEPDPKKRFANAQAVLQALDDRAIREAERKYRVVWASIACLLLALPTLGAALWGTLAASEGVRRHVEQITRNDLKTASGLAADRVVVEVERRWRSLERIATDPEFVGLVRAVVDDPALSDPEIRDPDLRTPGQFERFRSHPLRLRLHRELETQQERHPDQPAWCWSVLDNRGELLATCTNAVGEADRETQQQNLGRSYAYRDYFHGLGGDRGDVDERPEPIDGPYHLSTAFSGKDSNLPQVGLSVPIRGEGDALVGVLVAVVLVGDFADFLPMDEPLATPADGDGETRVGRLLFSLVDRRPVYLGKPPEPGRPNAIYGHHRGDADRALEHIKPGEEILETDDQGFGWSDSYHDPFAKVDPSAFGELWYAAARPIGSKLLSRDDSTGDVDLGWCVLVQQPVAVVNGPISAMTQGLWRYFWLASAAIAGVASLMLGFVLLTQSGRYESRVRRWLRRQAGLTSSNSSRFSTGRSSSTGREPSGSLGRSSPPSEADPSRAPAAFASLALSVAMPGRIDPRAARTQRDPNADYTVTDPRHVGTLRDPRTDHTAPDPRLDLSDLDRPRDRRGSDPGQGGLVDEAGPD